MGDTLAAEALGGEDGEGSPPTPPADNCMPHSHHQQKVLTHQLNRSCVKARSTVVSLGNSG